MDDLLFKVAEAYKELMNYEYILIGGTSNFLFTLYKCLFTPMLLKKSDNNDIILTSHEKVDIEQKLNIQFLFLGLFGNILCLA